MLQHYIFIKEIKIMSLNIKSKKVIASVMALSIVASGVISSEASVFSKIISTNTISASAAYTSEDWEYEYVTNSTIKITKYKGTEANIVIPNKINNKTVVELEYGLFQYNNKIKSVTLPNSITEIPENCFYRAKKLENVTMHYGIKTIGSMAFFDTLNLQSISLPSSVKTIKNSAFNGSGIFYIYIPSATSIEQEAFAFCNNLTSITLPSNLNYLGNFSFDECLNLKSVTISNVINYADCHSFGNCEALENINIPNPNVLESLLSKNSLYNCPNLYKINNKKVVNYNNDNPIIKSEYLELINKYWQTFGDSSIGFYNEYLNKIIHNIVASNITSNMSDMQKIKKLHDWVCSKVEYEDILGSHSDSAVFMGNKAVCDGYARGLTLLLREAGIESYYLSGDAHAWCMVKLGNNYYHVDACHDDGNPVGYSHFLKSDNDIRKCSTGHSKWEISAPTHRFTYTIPSTTPACPYSVGDANRDGVIDKKDVERIQKYLLKLESLPESFLADANLDGKIDMSDAVTLVKYYPACR